jgi:hypothetical protein
MQRGWSMSRDTSMSEHLPSTQKRGASIGLKRIEKVQEIDETVVQDQRK